MSDEGQGDTSSQEELIAAIARQLQEGKSRTEVVQSLVQSGMNESEAHQLVEKILFQMKKTAEEEEFSGSALVPGILGGSLAAVAGGAAWAGIGIATDYELGILAWGIGLICGFGVIMFSQGKRGLPLQIVAVVTSVLGVVIGKYGYFYYYFREGLLSREDGAELVTQYSLFSVDTIQMFTENMSLVMSGYDLLWVGLAVYTAWGIPKASGIKI